MWNRNKSHIKDENLDRFGAEVMQAFEASENEVNAAAGSPFLFRRIRARIEAEQRRLAEEDNSWVAFFVQVRRAIPVFALLAVAALVSSFYLHSALQNRTPNDGGATVEQQGAMIAGLPAFLQDADDVEASLVGWHGNQQTPHKE